MADINALPSEVLVVILRSLRLIDQVACTLVCKRWNILVSGHKYVKNRASRPVRVNVSNCEQVLLTGQVFKNQPSFLNQRILEYQYDADGISIVHVEKEIFEPCDTKLVGEMMPEVTHLTLSNNPFCYHMDEILWQSKNVKSLKFEQPARDSWCTLTRIDYSDYLSNVANLELNVEFQSDSEFLAFMKNFPNITNLKYWHHRDSSLEYDAILAFLLQKRQDIKHLKIKHPKLSLGFITALGNIPELELETLDLSCHCRRRSVSDKCTIDATSLSHLARKQDKLKSLKLESYCLLPEPCQPILANIVNLSLRELKIGCSKEFRSLSSYLSQMQCLEKLELFGNVVFTENLTGQITESLKVVEFRLSNASEESLLFFFQSCKQLKVVSLCWSNDVTDTVSQIQCSLRVVRFFAVMFARRPFFCRHVSASSIFLPWRTILRCIPPTLKKKNEPTGFKKCFHQV